MKAVLHLLDNDIIKIDVVSPEKVDNLLYVFDKSTHYWSVEKGLQKMVCGRLRNYYVDRDNELNVKLRDCDEQKQKYHSDEIGGYGVEEDVENDKEVAERPQTPRYDTVTSAALRRRLEHTLPLTIGKR